MYVALLSGELYFSLFLNFFMHVKNVKIGVGPYTREGHVGGTLALLHVNESGREISEVFPSYTVPLLDSARGCIGGHPRKG